MPRFYFHLYDDLVVEDDEGCVLPDTEAARRRAERDVREMAAAAVLGGRLVLAHRIEVTDESGGLVASVCFGDAVEVE